VKNLIRGIGIVIILCWPAAALEATGFYRDTAGTLTIAQLSGKIYCPYCGEENELGSAHCANCGKKLPELRTEYNYCPKCGEKIERGDLYCPYCRFRMTKIAEMGPAASRWERSLLTLSVGVGGWFGSITYVAPTADLVFNVSDYFAFGPDFSYFVHGHYSGFLAGLEFRPYIIPYSKSYFLKPHATVGVGYAYQDYYNGWRHIIHERPYVRPGGGLDIRIAESGFVPYLDWSALTFFGGREPQIIQEIDKIAPAFVFEGGIRITL
jgi:predicted RNA-binding Zn-ribbon protein involved in translation (DUF1610 family)